MLTRAVFAALLTLAAVPALGSDGLTTFYRTPYASPVTGARPGTERSVSAPSDDAVSFYRSPYASSVSVTGPARDAGVAGRIRNDGPRSGAATSSRPCTCEHS